jgi:hypothetical protein
VFHFGVGRWLETHMDLTHAGIKFGGASAGALTAASLACGLDSAVALEDVCNSFQEAGRRPTQNVSLGRSSYPTRARQSVRLLCPSH